MREKIASTSTGAAIHPPVLPSRSVNVVQNSGSRQGHRYFAYKITLVGAVVQVDAVVFSRRRTGNGAETGRLGSCLLDLSAQRGRF
jgi:hypothetical protein